MGEKNIIFNRPFQILKQLRLVIEFDVQLIAFLFIEEYFSEKQLFSFNYFAGAVQHLVDVGSVANEESRV